MKIAVNIENAAISQGEGWHRAIGKHGGIIEYRVVTEGDMLRFFVFSYNDQLDAKNLAEFSVNYITTCAEIMRGDDSDNEVKNLCAKAIPTTLSDQTIAQMLLEGKLKLRNLGFKTLIGSAKVVTEFSLRLKNGEFCIVSLK